MLVDVGIVLEKANGAVYAKRFLEDMGVPNSVIVRVLEKRDLRTRMHSVADIVSV